MKLHHIALAALAALSGQAFATNTAPVTAAEAAAAADVINLSGSSAAKGIIKGLFAQNCTAGTLVTFTGPSISQAYAGNTTISGSVGNVYACRAAAVNDWTGVAEDTVVVINKRDLLGSGHGVFPVAQNIAVEFTDVSTCSDTTFACTGTISKAPDAGISDEEPTLYNGKYNRPYAFTANATVANTDFGSVTPVFSQVFGVAVTTKLAAEAIAAGNYVLAADGVTKVANLSSAQIANLLSQSIKGQGWKGIVTAANASTGVNICTRDIGSGTRAAANTVFLQNGNAGLLPFLAKPGQANVTAATDAAAKYYINEAGSGGGVVTCLGTVNGLAKGYGIGLLTLGQGTNANYSFAAVDGVLPSRDNAKVGKYGFWVESTIQTNAAATLSTGAAGFLSQFIAKAAYADNLGQVGAPATAGVFALPTATSSDLTADCSACTGSFPVAGDPPALTNGADAANAFCSRFSRGTNSAAVPKFVK